MPRWILYCFHALHIYFKRFKYIYIDGIFIFSSLDSRLFLLHPPLLYHSIFIEFAMFSILFSAKFYSKREEKTLKYQFNEQLQTHILLKYMYVSYDRYGTHFALIFHAPRTRISVIVFDHEVVMVLVSLLVYSSGFDFSSNKLPFDRCPWYLKTNFSNIDCCSLTR